MSNDTFAHYVYGVPVKLNQRQRKVLNTYEELKANLYMMDDDDPGCDEPDFVEALAAMNKVRDSLRKKHRLKSKCVHLHIVDEDACDGSESEAGTALLGMGVLAFPILDDKEKQIAARLLHAAGAQWHSWVT